MKRKTLDAFERLEKQRKELLLLYRQFNSEQLRFKPASDSWSMLQVLRHLVTAESQSLKLIKRKMSRADELPGVNIQARIRAFMLKIALALPLKFKAPKIAEVQEEALDFEELLNEWSRVRSDFHKLLTETDDGNFTKTVYQHPRAGYLTLKQAIEFMEDHIRHHQKQLERIRGDKNFPAL